MFLLIADGSKDLLFELVAGFADEMKALVNGDVYDQGVLVQDPGLRGPIKTSG